MDSSSPETILATDYKLAMKSFINKEFQRSFPLISKTCAQALLSFSKGYMSEDLFVKIVILYLTELGLVLTSKDSQLFMLPKRERERLITELKEDQLGNQLEQLFGSISEIPSNLLYQLYLVYYTCTDILCVADSECVLRRFERAYAEIDFAAPDRFLNRFLDMYLYNVLPGAEKWHTAYSIAEANHAIDTQAAKARLQEIESSSKQEKKAQEQKKRERKQREEKLLEQEKERQKKEREEKSLKYKSLKQIKQETEMEGTDLYGSSQKQESTVLSVAELKEKLVHFYELTRGNLAKYSPVLAAVLAILLLLLRVVNVRRINLREKIKETLAMAMKVTYM